MTILPELACCFVCRPINKFRWRLSTSWCGVLSALIVAAGLPFADPTAAADETSASPKTVAGRTLDQHAALLDDDHRVIRLRAMRSLSGFGKAATEHFVAALRHDDPAMRYLAALSLGDLGEQTARDSRQTLETLANKDEMLSVRMAMSYALCRAGQTEDYLPKLMEGVRHPERGMSCSSAELIGKLGESANSLAPQLQEVYQENRPGGSGDYHVGGAAKNALRKIGAIQ